MISKYRNWFNQQFTVESYGDLIRKVNQTFDYVIPFRVAESPFFIPKLLKERLIEACNEISEVILQDDFKSKTDGSMNELTRVPNEDDHTTFLQMDFGITLDERGDPMPKLIEIQGFPSVYFFQEFISRMYKEHFNLPDDLSAFINPEMTNDKYVEMIKDIIVGDTNPKQVVMLEIEPEKQNTYIDFVCTEAMLGIKVLCLTKIIKKGKNIFYTDDNGDEIQILKIYNRVIFDELDNRPDLMYQFKFTDELNVEWVGHPNWFYRISKYTMPLLKGKYVPDSHYLNQLDTIPADLENYVLKPLFSFSGSGVIINVTQDDINKIEDKSNYLLQKKVSYEPVLQSPNDPVKVEIRMLMIWSKDMVRPLIVNNLVRLSKGLMIGVKYNKDKDWVGGSVGFFE